MITTNKIKNSEKYPLANGEFWNIARSHYYDKTKKVFVRTEFNLKTQGIDKIIVDLGNPVYFRWGQSGLIKFNSGRFYENKNNKWVAWKQ